MDKQHVRGFAKHTKCILFLRLLGPGGSRDPPGWEVIAQDGGTGNRWRIPGDLTLVRTPLTTADGAPNGTWTHISVNFTITSAFDNTTLPCSGETVTETPGNYTDVNPGQGYVNGTCEYLGSAMGPVDTHFQYNLNFREADMYIYQDFTCNRTQTGRPWRVHADCMTKQINVYCDDTGHVCTSPYPFDFGVYYVPLFPPPPLTNCSAGVVSNEVPFVVTNVSYNSVQSSDRAPVLGAAYVVLSLPLIDFTMRCLPSGDEMAYNYNGTTNTWYDCAADFTNPPDMPATWIQFNKNTWELKIVQEFSCDDADKDHPEYITATGTTMIPRECADTWNGIQSIDCWSTKVVTFLAENVTKSLERPPPHTLPLAITGGGSNSSRTKNKVAVVSNPTVVLDSESERFATEFFLKMAGIPKEMLNPDVLPKLLGNPLVPANRSRVAPGYLFVGPYFGPEQPTAYIFRDDGDLVWSGLGYLGGAIGANPHVTRYNGQDVLAAFAGVVDLSHGHGFGTPVLLAKEGYRQVAVARPRAPRLVDLHEFRIVGERTALLEIYQPTPYDLKPYGGTKEHQWIVDGIIQEIDVKTGDVLFESHSLDFAGPEESFHPLTGVNSTDAWDYLHVNSVDKDNEGNYLVSGRHTSTIYKLDGRTGSLLWRLGGKRSDFTLSDPFRFQHDARFLWRSADGRFETISLFDNAASSSTPSNGDQRQGPSRARIFKLDHTARIATELASYYAPGKLTAFSQGNAQVLPNGNVFVNWGSAGAVTEFAHNGEVLFHTFLNSAGPSQNYRGFRFEWEGATSGETPAIVALRETRGPTRVYVSWNGDTVTQVWRFYGTDGSRRDIRVLLGEVKRSSFETAFELSAEQVRLVGRDGQIFAEAVDNKGKVLAISPGVNVQDAIRSLPKVHYGGVNQDTAVEADTWEEL
ncbi:hypothetical protein VTK73DRAFT_9541 [Phialemonium thermophilum]|uniref:ASST-domain-containing protein n=1 Tax=Phialemonium thermophilum TaxID=223376 RepID=A0ABR3XK58_9PEZI